MRAILGLLAAVALLTAAACEKGYDNPNDVPRTVPPAEDDRSAATRPGELSNTARTIDAGAQRPPALV